MVKATRLQYEYRKAINRVHTDFKKSISVVDADSYINHAIDIVQEQISTIVERNATIEEWLAEFEEPKVELECEEIDEYCCYAPFKEDHYKLLRQIAYGCRKDCIEPRRLVLSYIQRDDISESLYRDPHKKPSVNWGESFYNIANKGIYIYKECDVDIKKVEIDYLKCINHIATPSLLDCNPKCYTNADGEEHCKDINLDMDIKNPLWRKIVSIAVLLTLRDLGQVDEFQAKQNEILFTEKVYL